MGVARESASASSLRNTARGAHVRVPNSAATSHSEFILRARITARGGSIGPIASNKPVTVPTTSEANPREPCQNEATMLPAIKAIPNAIEHCKAVRQVASKSNGISSSPYGDFGLMPSGIGAPTRMLSAKLESAGRISLSSILRPKADRRTGSHRQEPTLCPGGRTRSRRTPFP